MNLDDVIPLAARPSDSLEWDLTQVPQEGIIWEFTLGLDAPYFSLEDELIFQSLCLGLSKFSKEVWPHFQERTAGAILYRGSADFKGRFSWTEKQGENWNGWRREKPSAPEEHLRRLFCADAFAHYFQMLAHRLPDELPLYLLFDAKGEGTLAERHQILSKERFEHFEVAVRGLAHWNGLVWKENRIAPPSEPVHALCFPEESFCTGEILKKLDAWMTSFKEPFRTIPEAFLTEGWGGVDELHILPEALSSQGERKLQGFRAAGGTVTEWGE